MNPILKGVAVTLLGTAVAAWAAMSLDDHSRIAVVETKEQAAEKRVDEMASDIREMKGDIKVLLQRVK